MKLVHPRIEQEIEWTDTTHIWELVVENPNFMCDLLHDLSESNDDGLNFLEKDKTLTVGQEIEVIFNPTKLDFNNRRAVIALLKILVKSSTSPEFFMTTGELKTNIIKYIHELIDAEDFNFEIATEDFLIDALAKAVNVHIVGDRENFVQLISEYLEMMRELASVKLVIFVNLRALLTDQEILQFTHDISSHHLDVLLLECVNRESPEGIKKLIIDQDLCEI